MTTLITAAEETRPRANYLKRCFSYSGALLWNSLPENIRKVKSIAKFKTQINRVFESSDSHSAILKNNIYSSF